MYVRNEKTDSPTSTSFRVMNSGTCLDIGTHLRQSHAGQFLRTGPSKQMKYEYKAVQIMQYSILIFNHVCLFVLRFLQNFLLGIPWKFYVVSDPILLHHVL